MRNSPKATVKALTALWVLFQLTDMVATIELFVLWPGQVAEISPTVLLLGWPTATGLKIIFITGVALLFLGMGSAWDDILLMRATCIAATIPVLMTTSTVFLLALRLPIPGLSVPAWWPFLTV